MIATVQTDFATFAMAATASDPDQLADGLVARRFNACGRLPDGMHIDASEVVHLQYKSALPTFSLCFQLRLNGPPLAGDRSSGEDLDAIEFALGDGSLTIGTEDGESLERRLPWFTLDHAKNYPTSYDDGGLEVEFSYLPSKTPLSIHFAIAYTRIDAGDCATWFAVDIPHGTIQHHADGTPLRFH